MDRFLNSPISINKKYNDNANDLENEQSLSEESLTSISQNAIDDQKKVQDSK